MVLRNGSLSPNMIQAVIKKSEIYKNVPVYTKRKHYSISDDVMADAPG